MKRHLDGASVPVYETGGSLGAFGTIAAGERFRVSVDDGVVRCWRNGEVFHTSARPAQSPLLMDASFSAADARRAWRTR